MRLLLAILLMVGPVPGQLKPGDPAPLPEAEMLFGSPFHHLDETRGKGVLYVWFLPEAGGSRTLARSLNAIQAKWGPRGLVVVAVSHRAEEVLERWVKAVRPRFVVACEPSNLSMGSYPFHAWPAVAVADVRGRLVWRGSTLEVPEGPLRKAVRGARIEGPDAPLQMALDLPPALLAAQRALELGKLDRALKLLLASKEKGAQEAVQAVNELLLAKTERARKADKECDLARAELIWKRIREHAPGSRFGKEAKEALKRYARDRDLKLELEAQRILWEAEAALADRSWDAAERLLKKITASRFKGTKALARARTLLESLK